jgi:AraC-like DNA-binding protein
MPIIIDNQLQEQIPYTLTNYPISFYEDELATLPQFSGPLHWHCGFEIATCLTGVLDYQVSNKHITLNANDSIFVNGNILHSIKQISGTRPEPMPNVVFSGSLVAPEGSLIHNKYIAPILQMDNLPFIVFRSNDKLLQEIHQQIKEIYHSFREQPLCYEMVIQRNISSIFEYIYCNLDLFPKYQSNRIQLINQIRLQKMLNFIHHHYQEQITLEDIAKAGNISRSEAGRIFKSFMNTSPIEALIKYRLEIAHKKLAEKIYTVEEISFLCGFNSVNYFRRQFKLQYNYTPSKVATSGK